MIFERTIQLIGEEKFKRIQDSTVLIFGLGGVGGHSCEALVRSGVGKVIIVDDDLIEKSNINRQIIALHSTLGRPKTEVMKERLLDINPECEVITYQTFYDYNTKDEIFNHRIDFICDAIDTVTYKIDIIKEALNRDIPFISSMGAASKMKPELFQIDDINNTSHCPVAKRIRKKLRSQKVTGKIPVIYSKEEPQKLDSWKYSPSSNAFVPGVAGLICASYIINKLIE
jgi:tRNA A37 threonylcarbamoyladenosine dehydratase